MATPPFWVFKFPFHIEGLADHERRDSHILLLRRKQYVGVDKIKTLVTEYRLKMGTSSSAPQETVTLPSSLADLPPELVSMVADAMPFDDLKYLRLVSRSMEEATYASFAHRVKHLTVLPGRDSVACVGTLLNDTRLRVNNVDKLTIDFTDGYIEGLRAPESSALVLSLLLMISKLGHPFELELLHRDPVAGREPPAIARHDELLYLLSEAIKWNRQKLQNLTGLTIDGLSCTTGLKEIEDEMNPILKSLTLKSITLDRYRFRRYFLQWLPLRFWKLERLRLCNVQILGPTTYDPSIATAELGLGKLFPALKPPRSTWHFRRPRIITGREKKFYDQNGVELGFVRVKLDENEATMTCLAAMRWLGRDLFPEYLRI